MLIVWTKTCLTCYVIEIKYGNAQDWAGLLNKKTRKCKGSADTQRSASFNIPLLILSFRILLINWYSQVELWVPSSIPGCYIFVKNYFFSCLPDKTLHFVVKFPYVIVVVRLFQQNCREKPYIYRRDWNMRSGNPGPRAKSLTFLPHGHPVFFLAPGFHSIKLVLLITFSRFEN